MFMIRLVLRSSAHPVPLYLVEATRTEFPTHFDTRWGLPGNKLQTYAKEEIAQRAFDELAKQKPFLEFYQWDDTDAVMSGESYRGRQLAVLSYEIQLVDFSGGRIPVRFSGPR